MSESASGAVNKADERRRIGKAIGGKKGRGGMEGKSFSMLVHAYWQSPQYAKLPPGAVKLLVDLVCQFRGSNNGDLTTAWSVMRLRGWRSKAMLHKARKELEARGWILRTRQGSINAPTLYALTFAGIDDCRDSYGKLKFDPGVRPDPKPLHLWQLPTFDKPAEVSGRRVHRTSASLIAGGASSGSRANVLPIKAVLVR
jgi:hypothetical protein